MKGFPRAAELRNLLVRVQNLAELETILKRNIMKVAYNNFLSSHPPPFEGESGSSSFISGDG
jgi:hypothetical protein